MTIFAHRAACSDRRRRLVSSTPVAFALTFILISCGGTGHSSRAYQAVDPLTCHENGCGPNVRAPMPFSIMVFVPTTQVTYSYRRQDLALWGGAEGADPSRGGIFVQRISQMDGTRQPGSGSFYPVKHVGPMTITSVSGQTVSLSYSGGTATFSLASDSFALTPTAAH